MSNERGLAQLGGISFVASGLLFLANAVVQFVMGPPPSSGEEILVWVKAHALAWELTAEIPFFAVGFMIPAVIALYEEVARTHRGHAALGVGTMAAAIPIFCGAIIVSGRFPYAVFGITVQTPEIAEFAISLYYGSLHAALLFLAGGTFVVSWAMRRGAFGPTVAYLGFATSAFDLLLGYPDLIGPTLAFLSWSVLSAWFAVVGVALFRTRAEPVDARRAVETVQFGSP